MQPPMPEPLGFLITWTTYGTWLPGDRRWWVDGDGGGFQPPDVEREFVARIEMKERPVHLDVRQRRLVERTIADHCRVRGWTLHAVNARTNHVHVVVTAPDVHPDDVRDQFKAWCTRRLKEAAGGGNGRANWWTEGGSRRFLNDDDDLEAAIRYVRDGQ